MMTDDSDAARSQSLNREAQQTVIKAMMEVGVNFDRPSLGAEVVVGAIAHLLDRWSEANNVCQAGDHDVRWCKRCADYEDGFSEAAARLRSTANTSDLNAGAADV